MTAANNTTTTAHEMTRAFLQRPPALTPYEVGRNASTPVSCQHLMRPFSISKVFTWAHWNL